MIIDFLKITYTIALPLLLGYLGKQISKVVNSKSESKEAYNNLVVMINELTRTVNENQMRTSRYRIIRLYDEIMSNGYEHISADHWEQIHEDVEIYKSYCEVHPEFKNHKGRNAMRGLENIYETIVESKEEEVAEKLTLC